MERSKNKMKFWPLTETNKFIDPRGSFVTPQKSSIDAEISDSNQIETTCCKGYCPLRSFGSSRQTTINSLHWLDQPTGLRIEAAPSEPKPGNPSVYHWSKEKHCLPPQENAVVKKLADHEIDQKSLRSQTMLMSCSSTCRGWRNALDSADLKIFPSSSNQICITPEQYINEQVANLRKIQCLDTKKAIDRQRYQQSPQVPAEKQKTKSSNIRKNHFAAYDWLTKSSACYTASTPSWPTRSRLLSHPDHPGQRQQMHEQSQPCNESEKDLHKESRKSS